MSQITCLLQQLGAHLASITAVEPAKAVPSFREMQGFTKVVPVALASAEDIRDGFAKSLALSVITPEGRGPAFERWVPGLRSLGLVSEADALERDLNQVRQVLLQA
ncbi:hypothetical protein [Pseudomonas sp. GOM6]|uniref:hypothetical protein n=1 Tax=Pseudomonas sp. GOM6 TaxID=3036944 RepID=UPI00240A09C5|nr:hypothetical protein [Pseudomonas sp. GOM6]MDG1580887.1 hypothetical protein [Pseudomonas sp. GOM6]